MRDEVFQEILSVIDLPIGELLNDGSTYRVTTKDFHKINTVHMKELSSFEKFLVLTHNREFIVGGILFYDYVNIQALVFPQYRGQHYMSNIHKNGILKSECYPNQIVTVERDSIESFADFKKKHYLLSCVGLKISNLDEIHRYFTYFARCEKYGGFHKYSKEEFIEKFS